MWIDDDVLRKCDQDLVVSSWVPDRLVVVLGASNDPNIEVNLSRCATDEVPVLKRYGGGGTVVLHDGCAVVTIGCWVRQHFQNQYYFGLVNHAVIAAMADRWPRLTLGQSGLSDIVHGDLKVAGTSLFRSRNYLLYQASILVDCQPDIIERYLNHPSREPDYRRGRDHRSFLTGLNTLEPQLSASDCVDQLRALLPAKMRQLLADELVPSMPEQWSGLQRRAGL